MSEEHENAGAQDLCPDKIVLFSLGPPAGEPMYRLVLEIPGIKRMIGNRQQVLGEARDAIMAQLDMKGDCDLAINNRALAARVTEAMRDGNPHSDPQGEAYLRDIADAAQQ
jgi:hypothetical protein